MPRGHHHHQRHHGSTSPTTTSPPSSRVVSPVNGSAFLTNNSELIHVAAKLGVPEGTAPSTSALTAPKGEADLSVVDLAFGETSDLYLDVLRVRPDANAEEVQMAYFDRRSELFSLLAGLDTADGNPDTVKKRDRAEMKMDAIVMAVRILGDLKLRNQYDHIRQQRSRILNVNAATPLLPRMVSPSSSPVPSSPTKSHHHHAIIQQTRSQKTTSSGRDPDGDYLSVYNESQRPQYDASSRRHHRKKHRSTAHTDEAKQPLAAETTAASVRGNAPIMESHRLTPVRTPALTATRHASAGRRSKQHHSSSLSLPSPPPPPPPRPTSRQRQRGATPTTADNATPLPTVSARTGRTSRSLRSSARSARAPAEDNKIDPQHYDAVTNTKYDFMYREENVIEDDEDDDHDEDEDEDEIDESLIVDATTVGDTTYSYDPYVAQSETFASTYLSDETDYFEEDDTTLGDGETATLTLEDGTITSMENPIALGSGGRGTPDGTTKHKNKDYVSATSSNNNNNSLTSSKKKKKKKTEAEAAVNNAQLSTATNTPLISKIQEEVAGTFEDTLLSFEQVFNAFTLQETEINAVVGRIEKAKRLLYEEE